MSPAVYKLELLGRSGLLVEFPAHLRRNEPVGRAMQVKHRHLQTAHLVYPNVAKAGGFQTRRLRVKS